MPPKEILLTKGKVALVDEDDFNYLNQFSWYYSDHGYAIRSEIGKSKKRKHIRMHREILNAPDEKEVDHINGNKLDNQKENLRLCTSQENSRNSKVPKHNSSGYKGVSWHKASNKWRAYIKYNSKTLHIGTFNSLEEAVKAYNDKAIELFGSFAKLNKEVSHSTQRLA